VTTSDASRAAGAKLLKRSRPPPSAMAVCGNTIVSRVSFAKSFEWRLRRRGPFVMLPLAMVMCLKVTSGTDRGAAEKCLIIPDVDGLCRRSVIVSPAVDRDFRVRRSDGHREREMRCSELRPPQLNVMVPPRGNLRPPSAASGARRWCSRFQPRRPIATVDVNKRKLRLR